MTPQIGAGTILGKRFVLTSRIAVGGMGQVWRARDQQTNDMVAVKVLLPELAGQKPFLDRLRVEAANARGLKHPNLCQVIGSGEADGLGWIVMELVNGMPMTDLLASERHLSANLILSIMRQTALGLRVVHEAGVVHRDIKPANIMVDRYGHVKLTDFGISRAQDQVTLTQPGMVMGTAQYLSPEQALGKPASASGDLYALGIIAYESLVGHRPFTGSSQVEIAAAHVNESVPPLPDTIPLPLRDLVLRLLEKDPLKRPASATALVEEIEVVARKLRVSRDRESTAQALIRAELLVAAKSIYSRQRFAEFTGKMPASVLPADAAAQAEPASTGTAAQPTTHPAPRAAENQPDASVSGNTPQHLKSPQVVEKPSAPASVVKNPTTRTVTEHKPAGTTPRPGGDKTLKPSQSGDSSQSDSGWWQQFSQELRDHGQESWEYLLDSLVWEEPNSAQHSQNEMPHWARVLSAYGLILITCFLIILLFGLFIGSLTSATTGAIWANQDRFAVEDLKWLIFHHGA